MKLALLCICTYAIDSEDDALNAGLLCQCPASDNLVAVQHTTQHVCHFSFLYYSDDGMVPHLFLSNSRSESWQYVVDKAKGLGSGLYNMSDVCMKFNFF
jgi:hypothetical protein